MGAIQLLRGSEALVLAPDLHNAMRVSGASAEMTTRIASTLDEFRIVLHNDATIGKNPHIFRKGDDDLLPPFIGVLQCVQLHLPRIIWRARLAAIDNGALSMDGR